MSWVVHQEVGCWGWKGGVRSPGVTDNKGRIVHISYKSMVDIHSSTPYTERQEDNPVNPITRGRGKYNEISCARVRKKDSVRNVKGK